MRANLFREQVFEARKAASAAFGSPVATTPPAWSWIIAGLFCFFGCLFTFLIVTDFSRKETARGVLRYSQAEARVTADEAGIVKEVLVSDGDTVATGQPIIVFEKDRYSENGDRVSQLAVSQLQAQVDAVESSKRSEIRAVELQRTGLLQRTTNLNERLEYSRSRKSTLEARLGASLIRWRESEDFFSEGLIAQSDLDVRRIDHDQIEAELSKTSREINLDEAELVAVEVEIRQIGETLERDLAAFDQQVARLEQLKQEIEASATYQLTASISGVVTGMQVRSGEPIQSGRLMFAIVPEESELIGELYLPTSAIAFVEAGQQVKLQYDALPYQKFGVGYGTISSVSSTAFFSEEIGAGNERDALVYKVEVQLDKQTVQAFGRPIKLQSGMELSADIILEKRRAIEWISSPFR